MDIKDIQAALASGKNLALLRGSKVFVLEGIDLSRPKNCLRIRTLDSWKGYIDTPDNVLAIIGSVDIPALTTARGGGVTAAPKGLPLTLANGTIIQPGEKVVMKGGKTATMLGFVPSRPKFPVSLLMEDGKEMKATAGYVVGRAGDAVLSAGPAVDPRSARFKAMTEDQLMLEMVRIYSRLEPEALTCDGELPRAQVEQRRRALLAEKKLVEQALGREVSEEEAFHAWERLPANQR